MNLTIHRGSQEVGGSCVELAINESRIVIDIGMPLVDQLGKRFDFSEYKNLSGPELVSKKILPELPGFYRWDDSRENIDGLLVSHAHLDHFGFLKFVRENVPCYLGMSSQRLIEISTLYRPEQYSTTYFHHFENTRPFKCGGFSVTPFLMDHSAFDSYAFAIEGGGKRIIYSGDFRKHGRKPRAFERFLNHAPRKADALLLEGTVFGRQDAETESEVDIEHAVTNLVKSSDVIVLLYSSSTNIDRIVSFYKASLRTKRLFVIDVYTAYVLSSLKDFANIPYPSKKWPNVRVMYPYYVSRKLVQSGNKAILYRFQNFKITREDISRNPTKIMMMIRSSMLPDLEKIENLDGAVFIYSLWGGYLKEKPMKKVMEFIERRKMSFHQIHTGGHADIPTLQQAVSTLQPKVIVPIHTFYPYLYKSLNCNVLNLKDGEVLRL